MPIFGSYTCFRFLEGCGSKSPCGRIPCDGSDYVENQGDGPSGGLKKLYQLKPGYAVRAFMDEYLVIPVSAPGADDSKMAVLSPVAEFIWTLLEEPRTSAELLLAVTEEFDVDASTAEADIREFLQELESHGFLR